MADGVSTIADVGLVEFGVGLDGVVAVVDGVISVADSVVVVGFVVVVVVVVELVDGVGVGVGFPRVLALHFRIGNFGLGPCEGL